jgi:hypothetical protein
MANFQRNYYSTDQQIDALKLKWFDEGPVVRLLKQNPVNFQGINTKKFDPFRQGIEIRQEKHSFGSAAKISPGTPGHLISPVCFGVNNLDIISEDEYYDVDNFNPVDFIKAQENQTDLSKIFTFPIITSDSNQLENYLLNGIIEPFSIRPVASFYSIEHPFESRAVRGNLLAGNIDQWYRSSDQIVTIDDYLDPINEEWYYDSFKFYEEVKVNNGTPVEYKINLDDNDYVNSNFNKFSAFNDSKIYLQSAGITVETHGQDMVNVFSIMTGSAYNYVPPGKKCFSTGFDFDNEGTSGLDSLSFGGLTY